MLRSRAPKRPAPRLLSLGALSLLSACSVEQAPSPAPQALAQARSFELSIENTTEPTALRDAGSFRKPVGMEQESPASPGGSFVFLARADAVDRLSFATSFVQGNDLFLAPLPDGISLGDGEGRRRSGEVTGEIRLWDAGTEADEPLGAGAHQAPREAAPFDGEPDRDPHVRVAACAGAPCPDPASVLRVTLAWPSPGFVAVLLEVIAPAGSIVRPDGQTRNVLLSPGVFVIHRAGERPLFTPGEPARAELRALAEEGDPSPLAEPLSRASRDDVALSPLAWSVGPLGGASSAGVLSSGSSWIGPGQRASTTLVARPGDRLSLRAWYGRTGDRVLSTPGEGVALFDERGEPLVEPFEQQLTLLSPSPSGGSLEAAPLSPEIVPPWRALRATLKPAD